MTLEHKADLARLAEKATPGPWYPRKRHESDRGDSFGVDHDAPYGAGRWAIIPTLNIPEANTLYIAACDPQTILSLLQENADQAKAVEELRSQVYAPGLLRCAKCKFVLLSKNLNMGDGTVTANNSPTKCPNCDVPMWRVTERENRIEMQDGYEATVIELRAATAKIEALTADSAWWLKLVSEHVVNYNNRLTNDGNFLGIDLPLAASFTLLDMAREKDHPGAAIIAKLAEVTAERDAAKKILAAREEQLDAERELAEAKITALEARQRTPGTVEGCSKCMHLADDWARCQAIDCPLRTPAQPKADAQKEGRDGISVSQAIA